MTFQNSVITFSRNYCLMPCIEKITLVRLHGLGSLASFAPFFIGVLWLVSHLTVWDTLSLSGSTSRRSSFSRLIVAALALGAVQAFSTPPRA